MLRINASKGAKAALSYFREGLVQSNYYSEQEQTVGTWHGKTATRLGLAGRVTEEDFTALVNNRHPGTDKRITVRDNPNRRCGYDFTFNAPKSVSIMHAITKDDDILRAHREAVKKAMEEVEANMQTQAWRNKEKYYQTTSNLAYAAFEHHITRPVEHHIDGKKQYIPDCHLHSHCYVLNATWNEEKSRYQAVEISNIKRSGIYYEALYHNHLAVGLKKAGYVLQRTKEGFEIDGVSKDMRERFSNRTKEINQVAQEEGIDWAKDKAELGVKTRLMKHQSVDKETMIDHWNNRLTLEEHFNLHALKGKQPEQEERANEKENEEIMPNKQLDLALAHYMERKSAVPEKQVLGYALKGSVTELSADHLKKALDRRKGGDVISGDKHSDTYLTTREALFSEDRMKNFAVSTRSKYAGLNPDYQPERDFLNKGQREAIKHTLSSEDQVIIIAGGAGVGKTTLMKEVKAGIEQSGKQLFAFAPSAEASRGVLRDKGFEGAETIKKLLNQPKLQEKTKDQVILIDEAGMVGNKTMNQIFDVAHRQNARVVLSGDWKQHNAVESGDALRLLEQDTNLPVSRVKEIVRQQDKSQYKKAVQHLADGEVEKGFKKLDKMKSVIEIEDQDERHDRIANDYLDSVTAQGVQEKDGTYRNRTALVVSPTHAEGQAITQAIRNKLKDKGLVDQDEKQFEVHRNLSFTRTEKQDHLNYDQGMIIQFYQSTDKYKAGTAYEVETITKNGQVLLRTNEKENGRPLPFSDSDKFEVFKQEKIAVAKGDMLRITGNGQTKEFQALNNGESHKIKDFTKDGDIVLDNDQTLAKDYKNFNLGYYRTSHAAQGRDADDVFIAQSAASFAASNEKQFYVSVSRGVERCIIYTDDKESLKWAISKNADRTSADEIARNSHQKSAWLQARNIMQQQQREAFETALKKDHPSIPKKDIDYGTFLQSDQPYRPAPRENSQDNEITL